MNFKKKRKKIALILPQNMMLMGDNGTNIKRYIHMSHQALHFCQQALAVYFFFFFVKNES